jgi:antitoxin MazE
MEAKIQQWGNSLAFRVPQAIAKLLHLKKNSSVEIHLDHGKLVIEPVVDKSYDLDYLLSQVTEENIHKEFELGEPVGKEIW